MKIFEVLDRDPRTSSLANNGQARITPADDERAVRELRDELETFVCDGQYGAAMERILRSYLSQLDRPRQNAAWVSGFFGSGKSHLLKMLGHLWVDTGFADGSTARSLVRLLPAEIGALLRELDTEAVRSGQRAVAAAGTLPSGSGEMVRLTILSFVLRARGLPDQYPQAQFCLWLRDRGYLDRVRAAVEATGRSWSRELNNLYVSGPIAEAVLACDPNFATDERQAREVLREQFPRRTVDVTTAEFIETTRRALAEDGRIPLTLLILDEVQQYIGESTDRAVTVTEVVEAVQTQLDSRVMVVASGQSALTGTPQLQKLRDRFRITTQLSDADVEMVTRRVLLQKKPSGVEPVRGITERDAGEISQQLQGTRLAERCEDRQVVVEDYPLLPTRRRFWEECFRAVDAAGTQSQLRSQLRILDDALRSVAEGDLGAVIPGDALFEAIAPDLVNTGVLLSEIATRIQALGDGTAQGRLRQRLSGLVFLISKLPREPVVDVGVRATARMLADLMVDDLGRDSAPFRRAVEAALESLGADGTLMRVGEEYRLQTAEGAEWDRAFREQAGALRQREAELAAKREDLLGAAVQSVLNEVRPVQGEAKVRRSVALHLGVDDRLPGGDQVVVWIRHGWSTGLREVENEARRRGQDDPVIHVFLPREGFDDLRARIVEAEAAQRVLDTKGVPTSDPGREARESILSRLRGAAALRDALIARLLSEARVFLGGGAEVYGDSLAAKLGQAAEASLARLFPRFHEGDHRSWDLALRRARDGSDRPLAAVQWPGATEDHPVAREVVATVGAGARGGDVRRQLRAAPTGWPQDAIDAVLVALHRAGALTATLNGQAVTSDELNQSQIQVAEFRPERVRLGVTDRLALRGLYQQAGVGAKSGEEEIKANAFLDALLDLARDAGGEPPLPAWPDITTVQRLKGLAGTEQLRALLDARAEIEPCIGRWTALGKLAAQRLPEWRLLERLLAHAAPLPIVAEVGPEVEAVRTGRSLLEEADRLSPVRAKLAGGLRAAVTDSFRTLRDAVEAGLQTLCADACWMALGENARDAILARAGLTLPAEPPIATDERLLQELDRQPLGARTDAIAAVPERITQALAEAVRRSEPQARRLPLRRALLMTEDDVRAWLAEHEGKLLDAVRQGPVVIG